MGMGASGMGMLGATGMGVSAGSPESMIHRKMNMQIVDDDKAKGSPTTKFFVHFALKYEKKRNQGVRSDDLSSSSWIQKHIFSDVFSDVFMRCMTGRRFHSSSVVAVI
jgi:hypothetical protein